MTGESGYVDSKLTQKTRPFKKKKKKLKSYGYSNYVVNLDLVVLDHVGGLMLSRPDTNEMV
jgi:hypothetical protein